MEDIHSQYTTEQRNLASEDIDAKNSLEIITIINNEDKNISGNGYGHAVIYYNSGWYYRDSTLNESDNLSSSDPLPTTPGQTLGGWTKYN